VTLSPFALGLAGPLYGAGTALLGVFFLVLAFRIWRGRDERATKHMFAYSILYLFLVFALLLAEHGLGWRA
jgi:heme o synthase